MKIGIVGKNRYIDVDKFAEAICNFKQIDEDAANAMIWLLRTFPTADVVEVVRCKDCIYSEKTLSDECPKECSWCGKLCYITHEKHYCSYGERSDK